MGGVTDKTDLDLIDFCSQLVESRIRVNEVQEWLHSIDKRALIGAFDVVEVQRVEEGRGAVWEVDILLLCH
jgi:hypothetical protein